MNQLVEFSDTRFNPPNITSAQEAVFIVERNRRIGEIMDAIDEHVFSEVIDDAWEFADKVAAILCDRDDDKLGRINDLHYSTKMAFAEWLIDAGNTTVTIPLKRKLGIAL